MSESHGNTKLLDWDALVIGERLPTLSYVLTQEMIDEFRKGVQEDRKSTRLNSSH